MKNNLSVSELIIKCIKVNGPMSASNVAEQIAKPTAQVFTSAWKLVRAGKLVKDNGVLKLAGAPAMTAIKPTVDTITLSTKQAKKMSETISKRKATGLEMNMGKRISALESEVASLKRELTQMSVNYYDALAVIKYLESKVKA